jgi:ankyrin repeat protein
MLNAGAAVKTINSVLRIAARNGYLEIVKLAIEHGAELDEGDQHGGIALMLAITERREEVIQLLLFKGANANLYNNNGLTALMIAAGHGKQKIARWLLQRRADVNQRSDPGVPALMSALFSEYDFPEKVVHEKTDANRRYGRGNTALHYAISMSTEWEDGGSP